jgi:YfiH family protein
VHGTAVVLHDGAAHVPPRADAAVSFEPGRVCAVMTADCLPVVFADRAGTRIGVAHAGWRGLVDGVLQATITALGVAPAELHAWFGPAIGPAVFEVGPEVREAYLARVAGSAACFTRNDRGRFLAAPGRRSVLLLPARRCDRADGHAGVARVTSVLTSHGQQRAVTSP